VVSTRPLPNGRREGRAQALHSHVQIASCRFQRASGKQRLHQRVSGLALRVVPEEQLQKAARLPPMEKAHDADVLPQHVKWPDDAERKLPADFLDGVGGLGPLRLVLGLQLCHKASRFVASQAAGRSNLGAHACHQLVHVERLPHVVVRARVQAVHLLPDGGVGGQHDDAHGTTGGAGVRAHVSSVHVRHEMIEEGHVRAPLQRDGEGVSPVVARLHLVPFVQELLFQHAQQVWVVVRNEHASPRRCLRACRQDYILHTVNHVLHGNITTHRLVNRRPFPPRR